MDRLLRQLRKNADLNDVKKVVQMNGAELDSLMKRNATFTKGYQTGETKRSIQTSLSDEGFTSTTKPTTHYAPYLELGTRHMSSQPFVKPSIDKQGTKFISDMKRLMR